MVISEKRMIVFGCFDEGLRRLQRYDSHIATRKKELFNLWNSSGETWGRIADVLLHKPRA